MKIAHIMLQGKGGVGKSTICTYLAQYLRDNGVDFQGIDTDPVNPSFHAFEGLNARHLDLMDGRNVKSRRFDDLIEEIIVGDKDYVIDSGASSFVPLSAYLVENKIFDLFERNGVIVYLHTPVVSGQSMIASLSGLKAVADMTTKKNIVVWRNEFFGRVQHDGMVLEEMKVFKNSAKSIKGVIDIAQRTEDTFGEDLKKMLTMCWTFNEAIESKEFTLIARERLKTVRDETYAEIGKVGGDEWIHKN
ncbi:MAG: conjugal transfer protein TraL [Halothiobacillaceae bacterium]|nr:conjugal transfer protein TraL [Halothiobacillaceae bacterium]